MSIRLRFAPSPTGNVHIGNIRAAIFNWLHARHEGGTFLLRIEDTDLERSTPQAIEGLLDVMKWLGLNFDEAPLYQTSQRQQHIAAADRLLAAGHAYRHAKGGDASGGEAVIFRIPWQSATVPGIRDLGPAELEVHPGDPVVIDKSGIQFSQLSNRGTPMPIQKCLAGFQDLEILDSAGTRLLALNEIIDGVLSGDTRQEITGAAKFRFTRRAISYQDLVKGELVKPLDSMQDFVIVRSDGSPVFHLGNVVDDVTQQISHIVRGDDHVENTFRHLFLFHCLGASAPAYAHLPMIVNAQGKPYSKRDGDAYVGDFRTKGILPEALFNYLALLGWSPGDDREKMTISELTTAFTLDRVRSAASQMDMRKLTDLNGQYLAELPLAEFARLAREWVAAQPWAALVTDKTFCKVCGLMQIRTKTLADVAGWGFWFLDLPDYDEKACQKQFKDPAVRAALQELLSTFAGLADFTATNLEPAIQAVTATHSIAPGKLNQPLRVAVTGTTIGAGIFETVELLGRDATVKRLAHAVATQMAQ